VRASGRGGKADGWGSSSLHGQQEMMRGSCQVVYRGEVPASVPVEQLAATLQPHQKEMPESCGNGFGSGKKRHQREISQRVGNAAAAFVRASLPTVV
jgi:hypothetical protein